MCSRSCVGRLRRLLRSRNPISLFQHAGPDIKTPNQGARLNSEDQGKRKYNTGYTQYYVTIHNVDASGLFYNLQGGGAS